MPPSSHLAVRAPALLSGFLYSSGHQDCWTDRHPSAPAERPAQLAASPSILLRNGLAGDPSLCWQSRLLPSSRHRSAPSSALHRTLPVGRRKSVGAVWCSISSTPLSR